MLPQARKYIAESMGVKYAEGVILNLEEMWQESTKRIPMVCFLSMGSDPTNSIDMLARKHDLSKKFASQIISCVVKIYEVYMSCSFHLYMQLLGQCQWDKVKKCMPDD